VEEVRRKVDVIMIIAFMAERRVVVVVVASRLLMRIPVYTLEGIMT
jgi:hypothetical protein